MESTAFQANMTMSNESHMTISSMTMPSVTRITCGSFEEDLFWEKIKPPTLVRCIACPDIEWGEISAVPALLERGIACGSLEELLFWEKIKPPTLRRCIACPDIEWGEIKAVPALLERGIACGSLEELMECGEINSPRARRRIACGSIDEFIEYGYLSNDENLYLESNHGF